jgi:hypothetical protein
MWVPDVPTRRIDRRRCATGGRSAPRRRGAPAGCSERVSPAAGAGEIADDSYAQGVGPLLHSRAARPANGAGPAEGRLTRVDSYLGAVARRARRHVPWPAAETDDSLVLQAAPGEPCPAGTPRSRREASSRDPELGRRVRASSPSRTRCTSNGLGWTRDNTDQFHGRVLAAGGVRPVGVSGVPRPRYLHAGGRSVGVSCQTCRPLGVMACNTCPRERSAKRGATPGDLN